MRDAVLTAVRSEAAVSFWTRVRSAVFAISPDEVRFARRGFADASPAVQAHLERAGTAFVDGYNAAMVARSTDALTQMLEAVAPDLAGFAYEGASMGRAILDLVLPRPASRWRALLATADRHLYLCLVGAGWALPRLWRRALPRFIDDGFLWPLVYDGYGFHQGFFHPGRFVAGRERSRLDGYARRAFDQGLGRSLWFVEAASPRRVAAAIDSFDSGRRADLWSGAGLAAAYAGGVSRHDLEQLRAGSGPHAAFLAQGVVFGAAARVRAGNAVEATALATQTICSLSPAEAAALADAERESSWSNDPTGAAYDAWRRRIASHFSA